MVHTRFHRNTKDVLIASTIRLVSRHGAESLTTRAIAAESGVTEGAIYRHYRSKEALRWQAYKLIVEEMYQEKLHLKTSTAPVRQKIREWVKLTFAYFDRYPDAFTYVLLLPPPPAAEGESAITTKQGDLFEQLMTEAGSAGLIRPISPAVARCHFTGLMLNVPRLINDGALPGPASLYTDEVGDAVWRVLEPRPSGE